MAARWPVETVLRLTLADAVARIPPRYAALQTVEDGVRPGEELLNLAKVDNRERASATPA